MLCDLRTRGTNGDGARACAQREAWVGGVAMQRRYSSQSVVRCSRRGVAAALALTVALLGSASARAAPDPSEPARGEPAAKAPPRAEAPGYASALTLGYVLAPLLAIPAGAGLFELSQSDTVAVVGAGLAVVSVPALLHGFNGEPGRAAATALLLPLVTMGGLALGGLAGGLIGGSGCDDSDCELAGSIGGVVAGGLLGGLAGYVGYAIYDVSATSHEDERRATLGHVRLWARPIVTRRESAPSASTMAIEGATAGVTITF